MDEVKIILLGDAGVGKTSLINCFIHEGDGLGSSGKRSGSGGGVRSSHYDPDVRVKEVKLSDSRSVKTYLHDSPRREHSFNSQSVAPNFYRNADVVILVYAVDENPTLEALQDCWVTEYASYQDVTSTSWIIVGNKNDLPLDIDQKNLDHLVQRLGGPSEVVTLFASAKTGKNVKEVFEIAAKKGHDRRKMKEGTLNLADRRAIKPKSGGAAAGGGSSRSGGGGCC
ncbi:PREDICTED: probable Ras-related protein Rab7 [Amphimedon queenslandica]|uniref:Uncharacterized protein n=1 Tax=Amphimedon queenslandica TaxID=400682 RepID=A0A1X7VLW8_AMPQE|nr:PREDICTED: probable Ras-related protein Rab7 [Amphimedon queenslandica]|eukprot:XP_019864308.1 PREDICTED: probable Ras-related protein Rab7 [Amphimedon queenslandica]